MPRPYSGDLRARVIEEIATGASRREAAERYGISASVVVIWAQRWKQTGSFMARPSGGSISPLEDHAEFLLVLIAKEPDLTLDEIVVATEKRGIACSRTAVWRFFDRRNISFKKKTLHAAEQQRADVVRARRRWMQAQGLFDPARLVFIDETCTNTSMVRLAYVRQGLAPTLKRGEIVLMDHIPVHKVAGVEEAIEAAGATLIYLPKYSPDLNPIELAFSKLKALLRKAAERTIPHLWRRIARIINSFSAKESMNYFRQAGYVRT